MASNGNLQIFDYNLIEDKNAVLSSGTGIDASFPLSNLKHPFLTRPLKFTSNTSAEIIIDTNTINAGRKGTIDSLIIYLHNLAKNGTVNVKVDNAASPTWAAAGTTFALTDLLWHDYELDYLVYSTGRPSGLYEVVEEVIPRLYFPMSSIHGNRWIKITFTVSGPVNPANIQVAKIYLGTYKQFSINFDKEWLYLFQDSSLQGLLDSGIPYFDRKQANAKFNLNFNFLDRADARIVRSINYDLEGKYCFISMFPDDENDFTEIRRHTRTFYGELKIDELKETSRFQRYEFNLEFKEAVSNLGVRAI